MIQTLRIDLPILLPEAPDARDACVQRLVDFAAIVPGVERAHIDDGNEDAEAVAVAWEAGVEAGKASAKPSQALDSFLMILPVVVLGVPLRVTHSPTEKPACARDGAACQFFL